MSEVKFNYIGREIIIPCQKEEKMKNICQRFADKANNDINKLFFLYNSNKVNIENTFEQIINFGDKESNKMNIIVDNSSNEIDKNKIVESKEIICPECGEPCLLKINDYKLNLLDCKNNHENILFLEEFNENQNINNSKINCDNCKINNKVNSYNNDFYKCLACNKILCLICKKKHTKEHNIIKYDQIYYICNIHNEKYDSYCKDCKLNLCILCKHDKNHNIINFKNITIDKINIENEIKELKIKIEKFKEEIIKIINKLQRIKYNIDIYIKINETLINNYNIKDRCYERFNNLNNISKYNKKIIKDINNIINENNIYNKFNNIIKIYDRMYEQKFTIIYSINENDKKIKIFGKTFVENNINNCKIKIDNKEKELSEYYNIKNDKIKDIKIKLITSNVTDMSFMFDECSSLLSFPDISKWKTNNIINMKAIFADCSSLTSLPDISKWNTKNVINMKSMFYNCRSLKSLPDISKWNTNNITQINHIFYGCSSLLSLPDISKWNINNVINMESIFDTCSSLTLLPDISKWNTNNVTQINHIFYGCSSLLSLPDISKWNTNNVINMKSIFCNCSSLIELPDISKWNTNNATQISHLFNGCSSLLFLPDISKWNTNNVINMECIFYNCSSLTSIPDISKWNINNLTNMSNMFYGCLSLLSLPDISILNINKVIDMENMF